MKIVYKILGLVLILLTLNFLATWIFVSKNNGKDYVEEYIKTSKQVKIKVKRESFDESLMATVTLSRSFFLKEFSEVVVTILFRMSLLSDIIKLFDLISMENNLVYHKQAI